MAIFLRHSWNVKPPRWGSPADVQYAIKVNSEKIYNVDPNSIVLTMPLFWGLPPLDYSGKNNHGTNHGATYKDRSLDFDGINDSIRFQSKNINNQSWANGITIYWWGNVGLLNEDYPMFVTQDDYGTSSANWGFGCRLTTKQLRFDGNLGSWQIIIPHGGTVLTPNREYNLVITYISGEGNAYINGSFDKGNIISGTLATGQEINFMARQHGGAYNTLGSVYDVRINNIVLTPDQIALFHALPYGLYQPVSRPIWLIPAAVTTSPPTTVAPTTLSPTSLPPTTSPPTSLAPTTLLPTTLPPTTIAPTTSAPTTIAPTTTAPTTLPPTTPSPTTLPPTLPPTTVAPTTLAPTTLAPTTAAPTTLAPTTLAPTSLPPTSLPPTSLAPTTLPTTLPPTSLPPTTIAPTTLAPTTTVPTSLPPTTLGPTTLPPTTLAPTTALPTTLQSTTLGPTTIAPTTLPPTTLVPTTDIPEAICIKTCDSPITNEIICYTPITSEIICYAPITEEIICYGNLC